VACIAKKIVLVKVLEKQLQEKEIHFYFLMENLTAIWK
jgi:hypothetical protein